MNRTHWALSAAFAAVLGGSAAPLGAQEATADPGAVFQRLDKDGDGKLTAGEIPEDQARFFERLLRLGDKNSDGALTREEFIQANKPDERPNIPLGPGGGDQGRGDARQRFEMLDRNKDGKVTLDEVPEPFRDRIKPLFDRTGKQELTMEDFARFSGGGFRPDPDEMFRRFDTNGDGKVTKEELPAEARERFAPMFERAGKNELTREDFQRLAGPPGGRGGNPEQMFGRLDRNGDGKLTTDEVPEATRPMVEAVLRRAGKETGASLTRDEFVQNFAPLQRDGERPREAAPPAGERRPEGDRSREGERRSDAAPAAGDRPGGERRREGDRPREGERPDGRVPEGRVPEGRGPAIMRLLDTNHDGRLSKEELARIGEVFGELDLNKDGQLDPSELIGGPAEGRAAPARDGAGARDANPRDGGRRPEGDAPRDAATRRESDQPAAARRPGADDPAREARPEGQPGPFFQRLDRNGDGKISRDEAPDQLKERFNMLDTNGDGTISLDEFRAGAQQLGDRVRNRQEGRPQPEVRQQQPGSRPDTKRE